MENWIAKFLSQDDVAAIENAVAKAEKSTAGEIVPMIVRRSVSLRAAPYVAMASMLSLLFVAALSLHLDFGRPGHLPYLVLGLVVSALVAFASTRIEFLQKLFTLDAEELEEAYERAQFEFLETGIPNTEGRTGVLIFVSLFERRAFILGDKAISDRMPQEEWVKITGELLAKFRRGDYRGGMITAIEAVGTKLAREFPRATTDRNELANHLVIKD